MDFNWQNDSSCAIEVIEKNKSNGGIVVNYSWTKPYCNQRNNEIAQELDAFQEEIRNHKYNDEFDSIIHIKK